MRPNARKIGVLVTDGKSQDDVNVNSQNLRDQGIELYAIGKHISVDVDQPIIRLVYISHL